MAVKCLEGRKLFSKTYFFETPVFIINLCMEDSWGKSSESIFGENEDIFKQQALQNCWFTEKDVQLSGCTFCVTLYVVVFWQDNLHKSWSIKGEREREKEWVREKAWKRFGLSSWLLSLSLRPAEPSARKESLVCPQFWSEQEHLVEMVDRKVKILHQVNRRIRSY